MSRQRPTTAEWEILNALWRMGPSTVREVHEEISAGRDTAYTTTLKLMQIMSEKGLVTRDESPRAHLYSPRMKQDALQSDAAEDLLDRVFGGSAAALMQRAISRRKPNREEIAKLRALVDRLEKEK